MSIHHELNLSGGREISSDLESTFQPSIVADSDRVPSKASLDRERQSSLLIGSIGDIGRNIV